MELDYVSYIVSFLFSFFCVGIILKKLILLVCTHLAIAYNSCTVLEVYLPQFFLNLLILNLKEKLLPCSCDALK